MGKGFLSEADTFLIWATSTLVFAGYCEPDMQLKWSTAQELVVGCNVVEEEPKLFSPPDGVVVTRSNG